MWGAGLPSISLISRAAARGFLPFSRPMSPLPLPRARLADCVRLPRLVAKIRGLAQGALPAEYVARFCDHDSVDEHFLRYFEISKDEMVNAVSRLGSEDAIAQWFRARPGLDA